MPSALPRPAQLLIISLAASFVQASDAGRLYATSAAKVYQQKCASCHGAQGGGVKDRHDGPLIGDASVAELAQRITETMPEDDPEACVGAEARDVAQYIYDEFYSYEARLAKGLVAAPRVELSRLTVGQYRNAVADLLATFTPSPGNRLWNRKSSSDHGGLRGTYFQSRKMSKRDKLSLERIDPCIDFDFKDGSPASNILPDAFTIIWQGSFRTRDTGYYDFRVHSPNGVRLYVNTDAPEQRKKLRDDDSVRIQQRLIDGWVNSGEMRTLDGRIFLLGERQYPIRLEFFKYKEPAASIRLEWKPPHDVSSVIDDQMLSPTPADRTFVIETPFPADDRSVGYERGTSVSQEWHSAVANAALATADEVVNRLPLLSGEQQGDDRVKISTDFVKRFATAAFRRPLTDSENELYGKTFFTDAAIESAVRRAVLLVLTSPHFLYVDLPPTDRQPNGHAVAARLAFTLWDSLPDAELRRVADLDRLNTPAQIESQADRMLADPRARAKLRGFFRHWLELEERDLSKDKQIYPDFDEAVIADLRRSLELFVDQVVWSNESDYRQLLQADYLLLNGRLQRLYAPAVHDASPPATADNRFVSYRSDRELRSGILTHPYLLSAFAYHNNTSPIHRGVFLTRNIIGRQLKPPPVAVAFENNDFAPDLTMREKVTELTRDQACLSCHEVINPLGFALENFDAVGRWRTTENDRPIDTHSDYTSQSGTTHSIASARDIAHFAVNSPAAQRTFITQLFHHLLRQSPAAYGHNTTERLLHNFVENEFNIRQLLVDIATSTATHSMTMPQQPESSP